MNIGALLLGMLFGLGLLLSGMANPAKVQGFLDIFGHWDPTLAFVMGGALIITVPVFQALKKRAKPMCAPVWHKPDATVVDRPLVLGSVLFGVGWGIAGICPGPSLVLLGLGRLDALVFVLFMLGGMLVYARLQRA